MKTKLILAALVTVASLSVQAQPISMITPYGNTSSFTAFGASDLAVTSVYTHGLGANVVSSADDLIGAVLSFNDVGSGTIGQLSPLTGSGTTAGYGDDWLIEFDYNVGGFASFVDGFGIPMFQDGKLDANNDGKIDFLDAIAPSYQYGSFTFRYVDLNSMATSTFLTLSLSSFEIDGANVVFKALVDSVDETVASIFHPGSGKTFAEIFGDSIDIVMRADLNVDPNFVPKCVDAACVTLARTTDVNVTARFDVPEPSSLAILGLGILGLGLSARRRS